MTDLERLAVAWELWSRRSSAVARGVRFAPVCVGMVATGLMIGAAAAKPMLG